MAKKLTHLQTFCNIYSHYSPNKEKLIVRRESSTGKLLENWEARMTEGRFNELCDQVDEGYNYSNAVQFNANAAEKLPAQAGYHLD